MNSKTGLEWAVFGGCDYVIDVTCLFVLLPLQPTVGVFSQPGSGL
jgi:hypothetical protein